MKEETFAKLANTTTIKKNIFVTDRGVYKICILKDRNDGTLYFAKWKNDILVELINLTPNRKEEHKDDTERKAD